MDREDDTTGTPADGRAVLDGTNVASAVGFGAASVDGRSVARGRRTFAVQQGEERFYATPLSYGEPEIWTVEEFYGYGDPNFASANTPTGLERSGVSNLFFYSGPEGVSLVVIHDAPDGESGGSAALTFEGLPGEGEWVVEDGPANPNEGTTVNWRWFPCCTDGGAFRGGLAGDVSITIDPQFGGWFDNDWLDEWHLLSGTAEDPDRIPLDPDEPVTIRPSYLRN